MKFTIITTTLALAFTLSNCATTSPETTQPNSAAASIKKVTPYPFDTCIVTDNELGSMGDPISLAHEGREVKFCCAPCVRKFNANPDKYLARLDQWIADAKN